MKLDPFTRAQLLEGDWSEYSGGFFRREWFPIIDTLPADGLRRVRAWDLAATEAKRGKDPDWSVGVLMAQTKHKQYIIVDVKRIRATPLAVEELVKCCAEQDSRATPIYMEEEAGSSGKIAVDYYARQVLPGWNFHGIRSTGSKAERAAGLSSMAESGHMRLLQAPWHSAFLDELASFPQGAHDDQVDAASLAFAQLSRKRDIMIW
jgi:predicted phage terminase large subunit-like protein